MKTIFSTFVGSKLYGTNTVSSDTDFKGIAFGEHDEIIGLKTFEQQEFNNQQPDGPGKCEGTIFAFDRYINLCLKGNPTVIELSFADKSFWNHTTQIGTEIVEFVKNNFITKALFKPYSAYHRAQIRKLQSMERTGKRAEEVKALGYDGKFASHAFRLARQCTIVMKEGTLRPTLDDADKQICLDIRSGKFTKEEALTLLEDVDKQMYDAYQASTIPSAPDFNKSNEFVMKINKEYLERKFDSQFTEFKPF